MARRDRRWGWDTIPACGCLRSCSHPRITREYAALLARMSCATMSAQRHCDHVEALATNAALDAAAEAAGEKAMADDVAGLEQHATVASEVLPDPVDALLGAALAEAMSWGLLARVAALDTAALTAIQSIARLQLWQRARGFLEAHEVADTARIADALLHAPGGDEIRFEVGAALNIGPNEAGSRAWLAVQLADRLPGTLALLGQGRITAAQARQMANGTCHLSAEQAAAVEMRVLPAAPTQSTGSIRRALTREAMRIDPAGTAERAKEKASRRSVYLDLLGDDAQVAAVGGAATVMTIWESLSALGRKLKAQRTSDNRAAHEQGEESLWTENDLRLDACRFDALGGLAAEALDRPDLPRRQHAKPAVQVQIDLPTLLGLQNNPGEIAGYGPIPAQTARELAADGVWQRLVTDPMTGALLDLSPERYQPSARLAAYIVARDRGCTFPGCDRSAGDCDLDHIIEFDDSDPDHLGGPTIRANLHPPDRSHHNGKTHGGWTTHIDDNGALVWTSPLGPTYTVPIRQQPCAIPLDPVLECERNPGPTPRRSALEAALIRAVPDIIWDDAA